MACPECAQNRQRAERAEEAERLLLLFTDTFSRLARAIADIEADALRRRRDENPPPPGAAPIKRRRYLLVPVGDEPALDEEQLTDAAYRPLDLTQALF